MLANIKSTYFFRKIFSYLCDEITLKIMKYNKNMQEILDINLYHYKTLSGKYIINELNGKTKEYDGKTDKLVFEGEYKDGKRNGKGKEYDLYGILIFEGEYKDGKRSGKGK